MASSQKFLTRTSKRISHLLTGVSERYRHHHLSPPGRSSRSSPNLSCPPQSLGGAYPMSRLSPDSFLGAGHTPENPPWGSRDGHTFPGQPGFPPTMLVDPGQGTQTTARPVFFLGAAPPFGTLVGPLGSLEACAYKDSNRATVPYLSLTNRCAHSLSLIRYL